MADLEAGPMFAALHPDGRAINPEPFGSERSGLPRWKVKRESAPAR